MKFNLIQFITCRKKLITILACFLIAQVDCVVAQVSTAEIEDVVDDYSHSKRVVESRREVEDHSLALGAMKKIRGIWAPEVEKRVDGEWFRTTQQIDEGHSASEVFEFYHKRLENIDSRELFRCHERACGSSNSWANDYYKIKELYGLDGDQHYSLYEIVDEDNHLNYISFYTVARGNKRVFAHVEWIKTNLKDTDSVAPSADVIEQQLNERGYYIVSGLSMADSKLMIKPDHLSSLVTALNSRRGLRVRIVGHDYQSGGLEQQQQRSLQYAEELMQQLVAAGVKRERLEMHGVGSLAPARSNSGQEMRLEIVSVK